MIDSMRDNWLARGVDVDAQVHITDQEIYELQLTDIERRDVDYTIINLQNKDIYNEGFNLLNKKELMEALAFLEENQEMYLHKALEEEGYL